MKTLLLAWRYISRHRVKTTILVACLTSTMCLPLTLQRLVVHFQARLVARAEGTPLIVGARGSRFDLALHALYFRGVPPGQLELGACNRVRDTGFAEAIPLHVRHTARQYPVVGTTLEYFAFRGLRLADGPGLLRLGDCVLGNGVARDLGIGVGDRLMSDPENVFDIAGAYPVNMRVAGVLEPREAADDTAVFVDLKTAWLIEGLAHGHGNVVAEAGDALILQRTKTNVVANAALPLYTEVTQANLGTFHFHGDPAAFPVTAAIALPRDRKSETLLRGRFDVAGGDVQIIVPTTVVTELLGLVFRVKRFFDANMVLVSVSTGLFILLVVLLSVRLRCREMEVMFMMGCAKGTMVKLQAAELAIVGLTSLALSAVLSELALVWVPRALGLN